MNKYILAMVLFLASSTSSASSISSLNITGGSFGVNGGSLNALTPGDFSSLTIGGYDGAAPVSSDFSLTSIVSAEFDTFGPIAVFTSPDDGVSSGFAPVTGDITNGQLTLDLSSWTLWFNGTEFNSGSRSDLGADEFCNVTFFDSICSTAIVVDTFDVLSGDFTAHWTSVAIGGPTNAQLYDWNITGNVSAVPVPAALWLFSSGLIGFAVFVRGRGGSYKD